MSQYLRIKNWQEFQHYKERNPPWIKLHRDLLRDYNFTCLQDASKLHLMLIWLLASQMNNKIPADEDFIKNQIGVKGKLNLKELIDKGFLVDDSNTLAECKQSAIVETEAEKEKEYMFDEFYSLYPKKEAKGYAEKAYKKAIKAGVTHEEIIRGIKAYNEKIRRESTERQYIPLPSTWLNGKRWEDKTEEKGKPTRQVAQTVDRRKELFS